MADYIDRQEVIETLAFYREDPDGVDHALSSIKNIPSADVMPRDEGIRLGAELAAMHGSDATSQDLEKAYWRGFEDAMQKRDVAPVVHGKWIDGDIDGIIDGFEYRFKDCSNCGYSYSFPIHYNYCPECGAKMDLLN